MCTKISTVIHEHDRQNNHYSWNGPGGVDGAPRLATNAPRCTSSTSNRARSRCRTNTASQPRTEASGQSNNHGQPKTVAMDSVNGRRFNQQGRIANGVKSGELTPHETANVEHGEGKNQPRSGNRSQR